MAHPLLFPLQRLEELACSVLGSHRTERAGDSDQEKVKHDLAALGDLRPGSLSAQYNVCGSPGCRCKATPPIKHGPYYQVSYTRKGKSSTKFVKKEDLPEVRKQLKNYAL